MWIDENNARHYTKIDGVAIYGFYDEYRYLSNFHVCEVKLDGKLYMSSEAAFMAEKTFNEYEKLWFVGDVTPSKAKRLGKEVTLRPDWEYYRVAAMMKVLIAKFTQNQDLYDLLVSTDKYYLEETNNWKDEFWGVDFSSKVGYNMLGKCLMAVRDSIK